MFLTSLLQHKKHTSVLVNGHTYPVGEDLVVRDLTSGQPIDVPEIDATKLLKNYTAWAKWPTNVSGAKPVAKIEKPRIQLVTSTGEVLPNPSPSIPETPKSVELPNKAASPVEVAKPVSEAKKVEPKDPPIPAKGEDWADPREEYSLEWLTACAKAYKLKGKLGKDKASLVAKLLKAMY